MFARADWRPALWLLAGAVGCNAVFGVDDLEYVEGHGPGGGGSGGTSAGGATGGTPTGAGGTSTGGVGGSSLPPTCQRDEDCGSSYRWCDTASSTCRWKKTNGEQCQGATECLSGYCPEQDEVCCDTLCSLTCEACLRSKTGEPDGICSLVDPSIEPDPDDECPAEAASTCGSTGAGCSGTLTSCALWSSDTECVAPSCTSGVETSQGLCDGMGHCTGSTVRSCIPYVCGAVACRTTCTSHSQCHVSYYCDPPTCRAKKASGVACLYDYECLSGSCVSGYCA